jgi:hypothetical protein
MPYVERISDSKAVENIFGMLRQRHAHVACPGVEGARSGRAYRFLSEHFDDATYDRFCRIVNERFEPGGLWPKLYITLLPVTASAKGRPDWRSAFRELFRLHVEKDQSSQLLVILDRDRHPDAEEAFQAFEEEAARYKWPPHRKVPFLYAYLEEGPQDVMAKSE